MVSLDSSAVIDSCSQDGVSVPGGYHGAAFGVNGTLAHHAASLGSSPAEHCHAGLPDVISA